MCFKTAPIALLVTSELISKPVLMRTTKTLISGTNEQHSLVLPLSQNNHSAHQAAVMCIAHTMQSSVLLTENHQNYPGLLGKKWVVVHFMHELQPEFTT